MSKHFDGMSKYTASKRPLRLVYFESFEKRTDALKREKQIKGMNSRKYIEGLIHDGGKKLYNCGAEAVSIHRDSISTVI
jgi:putative endonuclease